MYFQCEYREIIATFIRFHDTTGEASGFQDAFAAFERDITRLLLQLVLYGRGALMRILIADDEMMSRRLLQETLVRAGYAPEPARQRR